MALIERPEAAKRLARAIASDVSLYNKDKIDQSILDDNLWEALAEEIQEGRELYESRVDETVRRESNYFDRALIDIILKYRAHVDSTIW